MISDLGFTGSAGLRLAAAMVFVLCATAGVVLVNAHSNTPVTTAAPTIITPTTSGRLILETTFAVARWTVQVQGHDVSGATATAQRWEATIAGDRSTIFVQAETADPTSATPVALRWSFAGQSGVLWGEGAVAGALTSSPTGTH